MAGVSHRPASRDGVTVSFHHQLQTHCLSVCPPTGEACDNALFLKRPFLLKSVLRECGSSSLSVSASHCSQVGVLMRGRDHRPAAG